MDFLSPMFAAVGIAAAAIPVVLHMLRRAPVQQMPFSLVKFLKPSPPKLTKRSNIEHWPLMLLRILALVLIGFAFARPFLQEVVRLNGEDTAVQSVTILIDKSASMRRDGIYEQVQKTVRQTIEELNEQDLLSVVAFSSTSQQLLSREEWATANVGERTALIESVLEFYEPDWMATNTGSAMRLAADELSLESADSLHIDERRLILITDFQRGSNLDELKTGDWPAGVQVELKTVTPATQGNVGVMFVKDRRLDRTRVRLVSAGDSVQQEFELQPFGSSGEHVGRPIKVTVAPGQRRSLVLPPADALAGTAIVGVELLGDDHPFDNVIDLPDAETPVVKVAHIGPSKRNDPESMRYYLQRVLAGNLERDVRLVDLVQEGGILRPVPADVRFVVATDSVPAGLMDSVTEFFERSGTLLMAPPSVDAVESLRTWLPVSLRLSEADVSDYAMFSAIDFDHPLFAAFSDARFADFSSIRFWKYRRLQFPEKVPQDGDWSIVVHFDTGSPAIAEIKVGKFGRIILLAAGWHPTDSQLALSTRFAPLLTRILSLASPVQQNQVVQTVGDVIRPEELVSSAEWTVTLPNGETQSASDSDSTSATITLDDPGRYTVTGQTKEGEQHSVTLIAGLAASESRTETLPVGQLQVLGIGVIADIKETNDSDGMPGAGRSSTNELEARQKWWRWLLLAGLGCLVLESLWASVIEKRLGKAESGNPKAA